MINFKILLAGKMNAGKTTFITQVSDFEAITVDEMPTSAEEFEKKGGKATTVGLDYGAITVDDNITLHLFGTPGQERFDFVWDVLSKGALGVIILVDSTNDDSIKGAYQLIDYYKERNVPSIIGITKQELPTAKPLEYIIEHVAKYNDIIIPFNTYDKEEVKMVLLTLLNLVVETTEGDIPTLR